MAYLSNVIYWGASRCFAWFESSRSWSLLWQCHEERLGEGRAIASSAPPVQGSAAVRGPRKLENLAWEGCRCRSFML